MNILWSVIEAEDGMHIVPQNDERHVNRIYCWCRPTLDENVWVHHCADEQDVTQDMADEHRRHS